YHQPTARNGSGVRAHTTSSTSRPNSAHVSAAATGTATTIFAGPICRSAATAARIDEPVARPSSTRITVLPRTSGGGRPSRYSRSRRLSSAASASVTASIASSGTGTWPSTSWLSTTTPPLAMAPIASSSWPGTPSLRTRKTSSGASSALATSNATGTPPRGSPRTSTSGRLAYAESFAARIWPASLRSRNRSAMLLLRSAAETRLQATGYRLQATAYERHTLTQTVKCREPWLMTIGSYYVH